MYAYPYRVRYGDTDQMGFAYHAHYLRWFEIGRVELIRSLGVSYRDVELAGVSLPVMEARCRYLIPARYDDELLIETGVLDLARASVRFGYLIRRAGAPGPLAFGFTHHCYMGRDDRPVRPPGDLVEALGRAPRATLPEA